VTSSAILVPQRPAPAPPRYTDRAGPYAVSHRGAAGLAPENTLAGFRTAAALGVRHLEVDVRLTADGVCVAVHDRDLRRVNGHRLAVADAPWSRLRDERVGGRPIPLIEELLVTFPGHCFLLDVKDPAALGPLVAIIRRTGSQDRICLGGLSDRGVAEARSALGDVDLGVGRESLIRLGLAAAAGRRPRRVRPARFVHVPWAAARTPALAARWARAAHELGADVLAFTVDDPARMGLLLDAGFDGIITDRPDLLLPLLARRRRPAAASTRAG
jgi:glycerophosphoryl diester phosphodiesterase